MNEANMMDLFKKKNMSKMKRLTEGDGCIIENKFAQPFTGFISSYQLITCNYLCSPFIRPVSSNAGWTEYEYEFENGAMMSRCSLVKFTKTHPELNL